LDLTRREGLLRGGKSGPAATPGKAKESRLYRRVAHVDTPGMPFQRERLSRTQIDLLASWIDAGAPYDRPLNKEPPSDETWWSLKPIAKPAPPLIRLARFEDWARTPVDSFILARLRDQGLTPSPLADRRTLLRRVTYDLIGLPPTPAELDAFLADRSPDAYERVVDRLLASPHYGERWARHWMDVVHYAETHGHDQDRPRPNAWPYRDYLIRSFNEDKPYARFVQEQLAADALFLADREAVIALGFLATGPWDESSLRDIREDTIDREIARYIDRDDMVTTAMSTFISATVHCARCHDHKFDPIPQKEYYALQAVFAGVDKADRPYDTDPKTAARRRQLLQEKARLLEQSKANGVGRFLQTNWLDRQLAALPPPRLVYAAANVFTPDGSFRPAITPRPVHVLKRGDINQPGAKAVPGALSLVPGLVSRFRLNDANDEGSRRAALARWVTDKKNVLTWRSIVNRIWHYHFGRGLVETPSDFGQMGARPTHPELLDWLAADFRDNGGSLKRLHRLIVTSAVYRQSVRHNPRFAEIDADNRSLWRMNRTRLDAESVRDTVLLVAGKLNRAMGGPSVKQFLQSPGVHVTPIVDYTHFDADRPENYRRSVYRFIFRTLPDPFMEALDCPDSSQLTPKRNVSVSALQALAMLNNKFMVRMSEHLAKRAAKAGPDLAAQVQEVYRLILGRKPTERESKLVTRYAAKYGLANACRVLLNSNELMFVN
jgi:hypothetical protein